MLAAGDQACFMAMMGLGFGLEQVPHTMVQRTPLSHPLTSRACGGKLYLWVRLKKHCRSPRPLIPSAMLAMWSERTTGSTSTSGRRAKGCRELPDIGVWSSSHLIRMSNTPATHLTSRIARNGTRCWYAFRLTHQKRGMRVENDGRILTCAAFSRPHTN